SFTVPNSLILEPPAPGWVSIVSGFKTPASERTAANKSGRSVIALPTIIPPALALYIAVRSFEVYLLTTIYSVQAIRSFHVLGLVDLKPPNRHASPFSPPPLTLGIQRIPPSLTYCRNIGEKKGLTPSPYAPYP